MNHSVAGSGSSPGLNPIEVVAIDLGATSGRVVRGSMSQGSVSLSVVSRFANNPEHTGNGLRWNISNLYNQAIEGLATAIRQSPGLVSVGVDSWAVDYGRIRNGVLAEEPFHYRDERSQRGVAMVHDAIEPSALYQLNGLQFLPFNTLYQLSADRLAGGLDQIESVLLIPDLINFWLTGTKACERTNASTTGLLNVGTGEWDHDLVQLLELPPSILAQLIPSGSIVGPTTTEANKVLGLATSLDVIAVGSHDTASAVVAIPMDPSNSAYISCGTWGLVGVELDEPVLTEQSRAANFTNEGGVDGKVRFLHNVMGLWLLSETIREWESETGQPIDIEALLSKAQTLPPSKSVFDANHARFLPAGEMVQRISAQCQEQGIEFPQTQAGIARLIVESLAQAFADAVAQAGFLSGIDIDQIHLVGGGALNRLLCQSTATRSGVPVIAGPVEATALGNVLVQLRSVGAIQGSLADMRALVSDSVATNTYLPGNASHHPDSM